MVQLRPMQEDEFREYLARVVPAFAEEKVRAGNWTAEEALSRSEKEFRTLLPNGLASPNQHLFSIVNENAQVVGHLWFARNTYSIRPSAFIYDFEIYEPFQRRGYGTQALQALEPLVKEFGLDNIRLHVFAYNTAARALYEKAGYQMTNIDMAKDLD